MLRRHSFGFVVLFLLGWGAVPSHAEKNLRRPPGTTRYAPMLQQLRALLAYDKTQGAGRMTLSSLGQSVKGRGLWMVTLHDTMPSTVSPGSQGVAGHTPRRLFYLCRQHGHEPASTEAALQFVTLLVKAVPGSPLAQELQHASVSVVPMANPDGSEAFLRHNAHDKDINRDWRTRTQPETRALYRAIMTLRPDLMTDQHELYPNDTHPDFTETVGTGSGASETVVQTCAETQAVVQLAMGAAGVPTARLLITDHHPPRLAHRFGCVVAGIPTLLFETNRLSGQGRAVASRAQAHLQFMLAVLRDTAGERDQLLAEAAASRYGQAHPALLSAFHQAYPGLGQPSQPLSQAAPALPAETEKRPETSPPLPGMVTPDSAKDSE